MSLVVRFVVLCWVFSCVEPIPLDPDCRPGTFGESRFNDSCFA